MNKLTNPLIAAAALAGLALIGSIMNSRPSVLQAAGGPTVTIDPSQLPLRVTGSAAVSGTVAATQQGAWNVGATQQGAWNVGITDTVTSVLVPLQTVSLVGNQSVLLGPYDVSHAKSVRVVVTGGICSPCSDFRTTVESGSGAGAQGIDSFTLGAPVTNNGVSVSRVYDVPGTFLRLFFTNLSPGATNSLSVSVYARSN